MRAILIVAGVCIALIGLLLSLIPLVPGSALSVVGAGLVAAESRAAARCLDWTELKLRRVFRRFRD